MVSKERRGFFYVLSPCFFYFLCFAVFFLAVVWFFVVLLNQKFSAWQSVGNCTDSNWRSDLILRVMRSLFLAMVMIFTMLAAVLSQCVVLQGHKKKQGKH